MGKWLLLTDKSLAVKSPLSTLHDDFHPREHNTSSYSPAILVQRAAPLEESRILYQIQII